MILKILVFFNKNGVFCDKILALKKCDFIFGLTANIDNGVHFSIKAMSQVAIKEGDRN
ncbi:MAG: hypothetical protein IJZ36_00755 [Bacilli bacterium]|nr:hypothetical protein [Bacilli bacterium]